jgi:hypothetical protein
VTDSSFNLSNISQNVRLEEFTTKRKDAYFKLAVVDNMKKSFKDEKDNAMEILLEYEHLIEYD